MRKEYDKLVRETFGKQLKSACPAAVELKLKLIRSDAVYQFPTTSSTISGYAILVPDHKGRDRFTIEIGWPTKGRFPELPMRPSGRTSSTRTEFEKEEFIGRLYGLWTKNDYWWGGRPRRFEKWIF